MASQSSKGPLIGLVVLAAIVGAVVVGINFLKTGDQGITPETSTTPSVATEKPEPSKPELTPTKVFRATDAPEKSEVAIGFEAACLGEGGTDEPLEGVEVFAYPIAGNFRKPELGVTVTTDEDGVARFTGLEFKNYAVEAFPEKHYKLEILGVGDGDRVTFAFEPAVPFTGTVLHAETRQPMPDVGVKLQSALKAGLIASRIAKAQKRGQEVEDIEGFNQKQPRFLMEFVTDENGGFRAPAIPMGYSFNTVIDHPGFDPVNAKFNTRDPEAITREYLLQPRTEIYGKIVDDITGEPVAGALVQATEGGVPLMIFEQWGLEPAVFEAVSDENGEYRLSNIPRGRQLILVEHDGYHKFQEGFDLTQREPKEFNIRLFRGATVAGRVLDASGRPVENCSVYWAFPEEMLFREHSFAMKEPSITGPDGAFSFSDLAPERPFHIIAVHDEYMEGKNENLVLQSGENLTGIEIFVSRGGEISGIVQTNDRQPIEGALITARSVRPNRPAMPKVSSQADGTFVIKNTPPGTYELTCEAEGYCRRVTRNVKDVTTGVRFNMVEEAIFSGVARDMAGDPLEKFRIRAKPSTDTAARKLITQTFRGEEGKFELDGLLPDSWDFEFTAEDHAPLVLGNVNLREGERREETVTLTLGASARGQVLSSSGRAIENCLVRFEFLESFVPSDKTYLELQAKAGRNGEYEMKNLLPGKYSVWASHPAYIQSPKEVTILDGPPTQVDLILVRPAKLRLFVRDVNGNPVSNAVVRLFQGKSPLDSAERVFSPGAVGVRFDNQAGKTGIMSMSDADSSTVGINTPVPDSGELVWSRKQPGDWTLWVTAPGYLKYEATVPLISGKEVIHEAIMELLSEGGNDPQKKRKNRKNRNKNKNGEGTPGAGEGS